MFEAAPGSYYMAVRLRNIWTRPLPAGSLVGTQPGFFRDRWPADQAIELQFPDGMTIEIPPTDQAYVRVVQFSTDPVTLEGFETDGTLAATARTDGRTRVEHVLPVRGQALTRLVLHGGANEALLLEVCLHHSTGHPRR